MMRDLTLSSRLLSQTIHISSASEILVPDSPKGYI